MTKVFKRSDSKFWYADFFIGSVRKKPRTTVPVTEPKKNAEREASILESAAREEAAGTLSGQRIQDLARSMTGKGKAPSFHKLAEVFREERKNGIKSNTLQSYEFSHKNLADYLGVKADAPISSITKDDVKGWRDYQVRQGAKASGIRTRFIRCRAVFTEALKDRAVLLDPFDGVVLPAESKVTRVKGVYADGIEKLRCATDRPEWDMMFQLAYYTGLRFGDLCMSRVEWFDLDKGMMKLFPAKQQLEHEREMVVPIHSEVIRLLKSWEGSAGGYLFPEIAEQYRKTRQSPTGYAGDRFRVAKVNGSFHGIRHGFNTQLARAMVPGNIREVFMHHKDESTNAIYTHWTVEAMRPYIEIIPKLAQ